MFCMYQFRKMQFIHQCHALQVFLFRFSLDSLVIGCMKSVTLVLQQFGRLLLHYVIFFLQKRKLLPDRIFLSNFLWFLFFLSASIIPSIFAIAGSYAGCEELLVVTLLTVSIAGQGFNAAGTTLNMFDLAPNYIGVLTGVVNSVSTLASLLAPTVVGFLTPHVRFFFLFIWKT